MPAPSTSDELLDLTRKSGVVDETRLAAYLQKLRSANALPPEPSKLAGLLIRDGLLTHFQAEQLMQGKWRRFTIGKYKVLERLGSGGMGSVFLCEHKFMRRRAAVKVLPASRADDPSALERFYREARAVAALDHPNIVRAYDIDQEDKLHFLVMEYVDGASLQEIVKKGGPLDPIRAAHYIRQAALGLQHAHETAGIVHRDIKPGNILVDRSGVVKVLDMGLARFFRDEDDLLTQKYDENVLGTADYLAPEQALDSHGVDIRADIYSLGATFYFCLTGRSPFNEGTVAQKLIWHQTRQPKPVASQRNDVPEGMLAVLDRMMAKDPAQRYQAPREVAEALATWTQTPIPPPPDNEMPHLSPAALGMPVADPNAPATQTGPGSSKARKGWQVAAAPGAQPSSAPPTQKSAPTAVAPPAPLSAPGFPEADVAAGTLTEGENGEAESAPWENLAPETEDPVARTDTAASPAMRPPAPRPPRRPPAQPVEVRDRQRLYWIGGSIAGGAVLILAVLFWWVFAGDEGGRTGEGTTSSRAPLVVARSGKPNAFDSVRRALLQAQPGDRIVVYNDLDEPLLLDGKLGREVTVESAPERRAVWRLARGDALLLNTEGFRLKGFTLDGLGKVKAVATLTSRCPGLALEDLTLLGFTQAGVIISNCEGTSARPVQLTRLRIQTSRPVEAGLLFDAHPKTLPKVNQHITVSDCQFDGPFKTPILVKPGVNSNVQLP